jgi:hypothetical protein
MGISNSDLMELLRNYGRLEQAAAGMFQGWADAAPEGGIKATLSEFAEIEKQQAAALVAHLRDLGGDLGTAPTTMEAAIVAYLKQIERLPSLAEKLRFNYMVMTTLERPVIMRALLSANPSTLDLFNLILNNEERILSWCDETASSMGFPVLDMAKYYDAPSASTGSSPS